MMEDPFTVPSATRAPLPTPSKTPAARGHSEQNGMQVAEIARTLFPNVNEGNVLTVKKVRKARNNSISADFKILSDDEPIEVFTDPENRLPKTDVSAENPFYGKDGIAASAVPLRRSARNQKAVAEKQSVETKLKREDGLLYVL